MQDRDPQTIKIVIDLDTTEALQKIKELEEHLQNVIQLKKESEYEA